LILGCTELPMIMNDSNFKMDMLNPTIIHANKIIQAIMN
jgi:aspartate/glutamate racemase